tara:strand:- start:224 stop:502 length:279 start_codon:yes stop_codon:yes gene_type:complete
MDYQQQLRRHDQQRLRNRIEEIRRGRIALRANQQRPYDMHTQLADAEIDIPPSTRPDDEQPNPHPANAPQEDEVLVFDAVSPRTPVRHRHRH